MPSAPPLPSTPDPDPDQLRVWAARIDRCAEEVTALARTLQWATADVALTGDAGDALRALGAQVGAEVARVGGLLAEAAGTVAAQAAQAGR